MKSLRRDAWLTALLFAILIGLAVLAAAIQQPQNAFPPLSSFSNRPDGGRALALWLAKLGYTVDGQLQERFEIPPETKVILLLEPQVKIITPEWEILDGWVSEGGTLILAGEDWGFRAAAAHYEITPNVHTTISQTVTLQTPLLHAPPLPATFRLATHVSLTPKRFDTITHLATADNQPVLLSFRLGAGKVVIASFAQPLTNHGLKSSPGPELALNLLAQAGQPGLAWFDEWHHGLSLRPSVLGVERWLRDTPMGHALLFAVGAAFVALLLQGGGFGRPVPLADQARRRGALEHVTALANLSRRAGHRRAVLEQYRGQLKRHLARRYRLDPTLPDAAYVALLAGLDPTLDRAALAELLKNLANPRPSEEELVRWAAKAAEMIETKKQSV
ncbi:MAG: DUF4350 domain-containing protein [Chloroflexota bacterium]